MLSLSGRLATLSLAFFASVALVTAGRAEIIYKVTVLPEKGLLHVAMSFNNQAAGLQLQMPTWAPGAYILSDLYKGVQNIQAHDAKGRSLKVDLGLTELSKSYQSGETTKTALHSVATWRVESGTKTTVEYDVKSAVADGAVHWGGPSVYLYELKRRRETCRLVVNAPDNWPVYTGLDEIKSASHTYTAKDYDTLADNPVSTGDLLVDEYLSRGKPHFIVMRGAARAKVDRANLIKACQFISDSETDFFGGTAPYHKYVWHFSVYDAPSGGGGLEHLSSTEISLAAGVGNSSVGVMAHEFFHLWNVKRIRSKALGPFDYTKLPQTGALWWLEGVTDYYAYNILHRYGWNDDKNFLASIASNLQTNRRNPAHLAIGPNESSLRVDEASSGRGNSNGYQISYYNLGWIAGMALDLEIRSESKGKHSLDDVELALWRMCRNGQPGFEEGEIRRQVVKFGGKKAGFYYDRVVMKGGDDAAIDEAMALAGLESKSTIETIANVGISWAGRQMGTSLAVTGVTSPAKDVVQVGDFILEVNGKAIAGESARAFVAAMGTATKDLAIGDKVKLKIKRGEVISEVEIVVGSAKRTVYSVDRVSNPTAAQNKVWSAWIAGKKISK